MAQRPILKLLQNAPTHASPRLAAGLIEVGTPERIAEFNQTVEDARTAAMAVHAARLLDRQT